MRSCQAQRAPERVSEIGISEDVHVGYNARGDPGIPSHGPYRKAPQNDAADAKALLAEIAVIGNPNPKMISADQLLLNSVPDFEKHAAAKMSHKTRNRPPQCHMQQ